jgi:hypothetical protein
MCSSYMYTQNLGTLPPWSYPPTMLAPTPPVDVQHNILPWYSSSSPKPIAGLYLRYLLPVHLTNHRWIHTQGIGGYHSRACRCCLCWHQLLRKDLIPWYGLKKKGLRAVKYRRFAHNSNIQRLCSQRCRPFYSFFLVVF